MVRVRPALFVVQRPGSGQPRQILTSGNLETIITSLEADDPGRPEAAADAS